MSLTIQDLTPGRRVTVASQSTVTETYPSGARHIRTLTRFLEVTGTVIRVNPVSVTLLLDTDGRKVRALRPGVQTLNFGNNVTQILETTYAAL